MFRAILAVTLLATSSLLSHLNRVGNKLPTLRTACRVRYL